MTEINVSIKFKIGEQIKPFDKIEIGKYTIYQLPSESQDGFKTELLLQFKDKWEENQNGSNPEKEGEIILSWLSVVLRQKLKLSGTTLNNINLSKTHKENISFETNFSFPEKIVELYNRLKSLPFSEGEHLLEKYVRACEVFQEALLLSNSNQTISFFLLVVCIECLICKDYDFYEYLKKEISKRENISKEEIDKIYEKFIQEYGLKNNFIQFILSNFDDWKSSFSDKEFRNFLSSIYKIRSSFTHEGEDLKKYICLVDNTLKSKTVSTSIGKKKEIEFPGLNYLSEIVRKVLINFLNNQSPTEIDNIPKLALECDKINLALSVPGTPIKKYQPITGDMIKHRN
jgi:hypothetical protein